MATTYYTEDHEWLRVEGGIATVGITDYAQEQLGDLVFVELPEVGRTISKGDATVVVESVKAASDVYAPVDGEILEVNQALSSEPALVNCDTSGRTRSTMRPPDITVGVKARLTPYCLNSTETAPSPWLCMRA